MFETLGPLCHGLPLVIIPAAAVSNPVDMAALIARERVTRLVTVPSLARTMIENAQIMRDLTGLRSWTLSGEEVQADLVIKLQRQLPECEVIVQYGSSEVSSDAAIYKSRQFKGDRVPIGLPLVNTRVYVLDRHGKPVPIGTAGEIHVGGVGVGRGYRNKPELTTERFVRDPFSSELGAVLYKMGDLGCWRADGTLEYLGRNDNQVKIRGFRIELGEIEAQLLRHEEVQEAVVVAREDVAREKRLVAYLTLHTETTSGASHVSVDSLRAQLKSVLPEYMVPVAFVVMRKLPRTPNGKLDRRALPVPELDAYSSRTYEPPRGNIEPALAEIWQQLLNVGRVGRRDNFFELGGHSLHLLRLNMVIWDRFGVRVSMAAVFQAPTVAEMADLIESLQVVSETPLDADLRECEEGVI